MQLGGGHVDFCQQCPFEVGQRKTQLNPFKDSLVLEKVGLSVVGPFVGAHRFALSAGPNGDVSVAPTPKDTPYTVRFNVPVFPHILARGEGRGLNKKLRRGPGVQGFVIYLGWRVGCRFRSSHV